MLIARALTTKNLNFVGCHSCRLLCRAIQQGPSGKLLCPRCGAPLHVRKPNSLARTWALIIAASVFYIPANVLPITKYISLGSVQADTILSGVIYFINVGMWPIAIIIFVASIIIPTVKIVILTFLLITIHRRSTWRKKDRTVLYRVIEVIGRWSMVDIFVLTIMVALVNLGSLASIEAGLAAPFFAAVVILTMLAAMQFDPRLIWDTKETFDGRQSPP